MAREDEELKKFVGQKVINIRSATTEEYDKVFPEEEYEKDETDALMVAELENGCKLYLLSDRVTEVKTGTEEETESEVAIAETENGDIVEIPAE